MMEPVYLFFAEGTEEIEALAVVDILRRAEVDVRLVSVTGNRMVSGAHGIKIETDMLCEEVDFSVASLLVLPGGLPGSYHLAAHEGLADGIRQHYEGQKPLAAICAAPLVYGRMGLLNGVKATCYPGFEEELTGAVYTANLVEEDGLFITGKGPAAVFAFGYALVARLKGQEVADTLREGMLYSEVAR